MVMAPHDLVLSRHRLPPPYRHALAVLWLAPIGMLMLALAVSRGISPALFDLRLLLPLGVMALPALYVWQEGVDVLPGGIVARVYWPRYYPYRCLEHWYLDDVPGEWALTVWDRERRKVLECRAAHLTHLPLLLAALRMHIRFGRPT